MRLQCSCLIIFSVCCAFVSASTAPDRRVWAWVPGSAADSAADQLQNASWRGLTSALMSYCGLEFVKNGPDYVISLNLTVYAAYDRLHRVCAAEQVEFHCSLGAIPDDLSVGHVPALVESSIALAHRYNWSGFNIDDESECAPRATLVNFTAWASIVDAWAAGLRTASSPLQLTADVQAMFGIEDRPYVHNSPCAQVPWSYAVDGRVARIMSQSRLHRWIEMDTYYFTTSRYLDAFDWYTSALPAASLGVGLENRDDIPWPDGYVARFYALQRSAVNLVSVWHAPIAESWREWLWRWKTDCALCPGAPSRLSCYEATVRCSP